VIAIEVKHMVFVTGIIFGKISDDLAKSVAHNSSFTEIQFAIKGKICSFWLDDNNS
jgi:hypothetical protein